MRVKRTRESQLSRVQTAFAVLITAVSLMALAVFAGYFIMLYRSDGEILVSPIGDAKSTPVINVLKNVSGDDHARSQDDVYNEFVYLPSERIRLNPGQTYKIGVSPTDGESFVSTDISVASVDENGTVTAHSCGKAVIYVQADEGLSGSETHAKIYGVAVTVYRECQDSVLLDVPIIMQGETYPNGCESVSAVMTLNYAGINMTVKRFINEYLDHDWFVFDEYVSGLRYGYSPWVYYNGYPTDDSGTYCFAPAIEIAFDKFVDRDKYEIDVLYSRGLMELCSDYISRGIPLIVWVTENMDEVYEYVTEWYNPENGQKYRIIRPVHCMVLVGYDSEGYYFNDPLVGKNVFYEADVTERAFESMWAQAIAVYPVGYTYEPDTVPPVPETLIRQNGMPSYESEKVSVE